MIALITPVSGFVNDSKSSSTAAKSVRWVIHGSVLIVPSSISLMIRVKSGGRALREATIDASGLCIVGLTERQLIRRDSYVYERTSGSDVLQRAGHRMLVAGGVSDDLVHVTTGDFLHSLDFATVALENYRVFDAIVLANEFQPVFVHVHYADGRVG